MSELQCKDLERVLRAQDPELDKAFERHASHCSNCERELRLWNEISSMAHDLRKAWESPELWPKIQQALAAEAQAASAPVRGWSFSGLWPRSARWALVPAAASLLALMILGAWLMIRHPVETMSPEAHRRLLTEQAVREVEKSEEAYIAAIQKLSALAGPKVDSPKTPLLAAYHEKLLVLDAAIDECRAQVERNPANPQLRQELVAMYREKRDTLQLVIREE